MCGIVGQCLPPGNRVDRHRIDAAVRSLAHRGPDGTGVWYSRDENVALGHRRLSVVDLQGGAQPLANEDGSVVVTFNGEIYNHLELRRRLERQGHQFRTQSDTEVLVHLYEEEGPAMLSRLNGMFAFAIWDDRRGRLFLARDRLGQKPLFVARVGDSFAFASEPKALFELLPEPPRLDANAVYHFLTFQYVPGDLCAFRGVEKLQPGEWISWSPAECERERYWLPPKHQPTFDGSFDEASAHLRELLRDATRLRLMSDVPLGVLLSGGLDSSVVVGLMREAGVERLRTFTAHFGEAAVNERQYALDVARMHRTEHVELLIEPPDFELVGRVLDLYDEPFADTSAPATYLISQKAREHVTVALTGDGGDESLMGYDRYQQFDRYLKQRRWLEPAMRYTGLQALGRWLCPNPGPRTWKRRLRTLATLWDPPAPDVYLRWLAAFQGPLKAKLCGEELEDGVEASLMRVRRGLSELHSGDWASAAASFDLRTYLPDAVLTKVDRASMAVGLECRSPFLDYRVVEFLASLPREWKWHPRRGTKWILRNACQDLLPQSVWERGKLGFGSPVGVWYRRQWERHLKELVGTVTLLPQLNERTIEELIGEHLSGTVDHTYRLWTLTCLRRAAGRFTLVGCTDGLT